jgi:hypothetical protein
MDREFFAKADHGHWHETTPRLAGEDLVSIDYLN